MKTKPIRLNKIKNMATYDIEIKVKGVKKFKFKIWIATLLLKLVACVLRPNVKLNINEN